MEKVYSGQYFEAMNVKNLLENLNIHVFVENDNMSLIEPFAVSPGGTSPVVLKVNKQNYNQAIETIKAYENGELALGKEIDKSVIIAMLKKEGFVVDLTLQDDCLYCAATDNQSFVGSERPTMKLLLNGSFGSFFNTMGLS